MVWGLLTLLFAAALILMLAFEDKVADTFGPWLGLLPRDPAAAALVILDNAPVIVRIYAFPFDGLFLTVLVHRTDILVRQPEHLPKDPCTHSSRSDLPILVRGRYRNNVTAVDLDKLMPGHVDIPRLRKGKVGAFFW